MIIRCKSLDILPNNKVIKHIYSKTQIDLPKIATFQEESSSIQVLNTGRSSSYVSYIVSYNMDLNLQEIELDINTVNQCEVCYENMCRIDTFSFECGHKFCFECVKDYFTLCISEKSLDKLKCLNKNCQNIISNPKLLSFLDQDVYQKYLKFLKNDEIIKDNNKIHCPYPDCESYAFIGIM